mgnify:CR=1 FL=1
MVADPPCGVVPLVVIALPGRPSTVMLMAPTAWLASKPAPDTFTRVPFGPDTVPSEAVAAPAAVANEKSGAAIAISKSAVSIATVDFLNLFKLLIFFIFSNMVYPFFHRVKVNLWVPRYLILL